MRLKTKNWMEQSHVRINQNCELHNIMKMPYILENSNIATHRKRMFKNYFCRFYFVVPCENGFGIIYEWNSFIERNICDDKISDQMRILFWSWWFTRTHFFCSIYSIFIECATYKIIVDVQIIMDEQWTIHNKNNKNNSSGKHRAATGK